MSGQAVHVAQLGRMVPDTDETPERAASVHGPELREIADQEQLRAGSFGQVGDPSNESVPAREASSRIAS